MPLSTTDEISIAQKFASDDGIILKLQKKSGHATYLDCNWISRHAHESEKLFTFVSYFRIVNIRSCLFHENSF